METSQIVSLYQRLDANSGNWQTLAEDIATYMHPAQRGFNTAFAEGESRTDHIFDSTAMECVVRWANGVHFALANPFTSWFRIRFRQNNLNLTDASKDWMDEATEQLKAKFNSSNFASRFNELLRNYAAFGTVSISMHDSKRKFVFTNNHMGKVVFLENEDGIVDTTIMRVEFTADQARKRFTSGEEGLEEAEAILGRNISGAIQDGLLEKKFPFIHAIYPREDAEEEITIGKKRPFASVWINLEEKHRVFESGYYENPRLVGRLSERSQDKYGSGPGEIALPDVKTLNRAEELDLGAWEKDIDSPIIQQGNQIQGDLNMNARGITTVGNLEKIKAWNAISRSGYQSHQVRAEKKVEKIREIFSYYQLDIPRREEVGQMTAYEVSKRIQRIYQLMGPTIVRIIDEIIEPLVDRGFKMMVRNNEFPPFPEGIPAESIVDVEYMGPMARAQKTEELENTDMYLNDIVALAERFMASGMQESAMAILDLVDLDEILRRKADRMGIHGAQIVDDEIVQKVRKARMEAMQQQAEMEQELKMAEGAKTLSQAVGQDTIKEMM